MSAVALQRFVSFGFIVSMLLAGQLGRAGQPAGRELAREKPVAAAASSGPASGDVPGSVPPAGRAGKQAPVHASLSAESLTVLKTSTDHIRMIYRAKSAPVMDLEATIQRLFHMEGQLRSSAGPGARSGAASRVAMASSAVSNSMVISGPPDAVEEVRKLLEQLDQSPGQLLLEMEIGETPLDDAKPAEGPAPGDKSPAAAKAEALRLAQRPAKMETIGRVRLNTLDNQPAFVLMGARVPTITGTAVSAAGLVRSTSTTNVGLTLGITPRISPDGSVTIAIDAEQSQLAPEAEGTVVSVTPDKKEVRTPRIDTTSVQSTVTIRDAQTVVLSSVARQGKKALVIVLTPHILPMGETRKPR
jgi:type II secretory pathway component GspD/PulD (secretin)